MGRDYSLSIYFESELKSPKTIDNIIKIVEDSFSSVGARVFNFTVSAKNPNWANMLVRNFDGDIFPHAEALVGMLYQYGARYHKERVSNWKPKSKFDEMYGYETDEEEVITSEDNINNSNGREKLLDEIKFLRLQNDTLNKKVKALTQQIEEMDRSIKYHFDKKIAQEERYKEEIERYKKEIESLKKELYDIKNGNNNSQPLIVEQEEASNE